MVPLWGRIAHGIDQIGGPLAVADAGGAARSTAAVDWGHSQCDFSDGCLYGFSSRVPPTLPDEINTIACECVIFARFSIHSRSCCVGRRRM